MLLTDLPMQLNQGIFEMNASTGFILKPDFMRQEKKKFDPFAESTVDGIVAGTVAIKVHCVLLSHRLPGCLSVAMVINFVTR